jgi:hypothetical protein
VHRLSGLPNGKPLVNLPHCPAAETGCDHCGCEGTRELHGPYSGDTGWGTVRSLINQNTTELQRYVFPHRESGRKSPREFTETTLPVYNLVRTEGTLFGNRAGFLSTRGTSRLRWPRL